MCCSAGDKGLDASDNRACRPIKALWSISTVHLRYGSNMCDLVLLSHTNPIGQVMHQDGSERHLYRPLIGVWGPGKDPFRALMAAPYVPLFLRSQNSWVRGEPMRVTSALALMSGMTRSRAFHKGSALCSCTECQPASVFRHTYFCNLPCYQMSMTHSRACHKGSGPLLLHSAQHVSLLE